MICPYSQKSKFLRQLASELEAYCDHRDDISQNALREEFGTPEEVANTFLSEMGPVKMGKAVLRHSHYAYITVSVLFVALAGGIWLCAGAQKKDTFDPDDLTESITIMEGNFHTTSFYVKSATGPQYWEYDHATATWTNKPKPEGLNIQLSSFGELHTCNEEGQAISWRYNSSVNAWLAVTPPEDDPLVVTKESS